MTLRAQVISILATSVPQQDGSAQINMPVWCEEEPDHLLQNKDT